MLSLQAFLSQDHAQLESIAAARHQSYYARTVETKRMAHRIVQGICEQESVAS